MSSIQVQADSQAMRETTPPGADSVLAKSTQRWATRYKSSSNSASPRPASPVKGTAANRCARRYWRRPHVRFWIPALAALLLTAAGAQAQAAFSTPQPVGVTAGQQNVTVTAQAAGTVATVQVLTSGVPNLDFAAGSGLKNCVTTLAKGATCTESVTFTPSAPGVRIGAVVLLDSNSNVLGTAYLSGIGSGGLGVLVPGNVLGVAGDGTYHGSVLDGNPAAQASLDQPTSITLDGAGNMYIADSGHNRIRKVTAPATGGISTGIISTIAGNGNPTYTGDGGAAANSTLNSPSGVALDGAGNLYIADTGNNVVRKIAASTGAITTVAGNGTAGYGGDNGLATAAGVELNQPQGVAVDVSGNLYIADTANHRIRRVDAVTGIITTVAGIGPTNPVTGAGGYSGDTGPATLAELNYPYTVAFDSNGNMYIPDSANNVVREVNTSGTITTFAGDGVAGYSGDGGAATAAEIWSPEGVIADPAGNVYIASGGNNETATIRKVSSATGVISTVAESGQGEDLLNGTFYGISIYGPIGLFLDGGGNLYLADSLNMIVQQIQSNFVALDYTLTPVRQGEKSATQVQTVENDGNLPLDVTAINLGVNTALDPAATTCTSTSLLAVDEDCEMGVVFAPSKALVITPPDTQAPITDNIDVVGNTANSPQDAANTPLDIQVWGIATVVNATTTTLASSLNPSGFGQSVIFTATVTTGGTVALTGTVTFYYDGAAFPNTAGCPNPVILTALGTATCASTALTVGKHHITATYNDNNTPPNHFSSTSAPLTQTVLEGTATALSSSGTPSTVGQSVTFTATVTSSGGNIAPDGNVVFSDGSTPLDTVALNSTTGVATYTTSTLADGSHSIVATYGGDLANDIQGSSSTMLIQDVQGGSSITVTSSPNPSNYGVPVIFTIAIPETQPVNAQGSVTIYDGGNPIGIALLGATGQTTFTTSSLVVGTHSITVNFAGDANYSPGTSPVLTQVVNQTQTTTVVAAAPNPAFAGGAITFTATVKLAQGVNVPTGSVTFTSGTVTLGNAAIGATGTATINATLGVGTYSIVATYSGDLNDAGSASSPLSLAVAIATTSAAVTAVPNPAAVESPVAFTAKVTGNGGTPTGTVVFSADGASIGSANLDATGTATLSSSSLAAGTHSITASYGGDSNDTGSTSPAISLVVNTIPTATALGATSSSGANSQVILVATVIGNSGPAPTGTVTFTSIGTNPSIGGSGSTVIGIAVLNSSGVATLNPNLATGTYTIVATYGGDALHGASTSPPVTIQGAPSDFNITVNPSAITMGVSQNATATVILTSIGGFSDTLGLGCATLPAVVTCHFSSPSVLLAAGGVQTAQVTIDTNNPLSGGTTAMNAHGGNRGAYLAGLSILSLPITALFGLILWRFRRHHGPAFTVSMLLLLSSAAMLVNGCGGFTQATAAPGTYVIQITATGVNSDVIHYQNVTLTITK